MAPRTGSNSNSVSSYDRRGKREFAHLTTPMQHSVLTFYLAKGGARWPWSEKEATMCLCGGCPRKGREGERFVGIKGRRDGADSGYGRRDASSSPWQCRSNDSRVVLSPFIVIYSISLLCFHLWEIHTYIYIYILGTHTYVYICIYHVTQWLFFAYIFLPLRYILGKTYTK